MELTLRLCLPRDESTVPLVRHLTRYTLREIAVAAITISDISLAITEACANVVRHAADDDEYEVRIVVTDDTCEIRVVDTGGGFDATPLGHGPADMSAETGRGIQLIRSLVDSVQFRSEPEAGTVVQLVKSLAFSDRPPRFVRRGEVEIDLGASPRT